MAFGDPKTALASLFPIGFGVALELDLEAFGTVFVATLVSIVAAWMTYRFLIRSLKKELKEAFDDHIQKMHASHEKFVETVTEGPSPQAAASPAAEKD